MEKQGSFGYKIGRKVRLMHVDYDADILWQTCVREIHVLLKHYGSVNSLRDAFEKIEEAKNKPKQEAIEKCKPYADLNFYLQNTKDWYQLTRNCQHSFINILDTGYILNNGKKTGLILLVDFNTNAVRYFNVDLDKKEEEYGKASFDEIMGFDDMPTKCYDEIITKTKERASKYIEKLKTIDEEIKRLNNLKKKTKGLCATIDMIQQASMLLSNMKNERKKVESSYRYFYHRLESLNLINHELCDNTK